MSSVSLNSFQPCFETGLLMNLELVKHAGLQASEFLGSLCLCVLNTGTVGRQCDTGLFTLALAIRTWLLIPVEQVFDPLSCLLRDLLFVEVGSCYTAQADLELVIVLSVSPKRSDYRCPPLCWAYPSLHEDPSPSTTLTILGTKLPTRKKTLRALLKPYSNLSKLLPFHPFPFLCPL